MSSILVVDDDPGCRESLSILLADRGHDVVEKPRGEAGLQAMLDGEHDLVLLDLELPDMTGIDVLRRARAEGCRVPVVMISGTATIQDAVAATQLGAVDFVEKPIHPPRLLVSVRNALRLGRLRSAHERLLDRAEASSQLLGSSRVMEALRRRVAKVARAEARVMILGEAGTGKELVARAIHADSPRKNRPFVAVNCAAIPRDLVESELFGHQAGAFTGATRPRMGRFEEADGGTLLLDEVGELSPDAQAKLLRVLEESTVERLGGGKPRKVDVRVVCATNRDLEAARREGTFRDDLYYRLAVVTIETPPLREHLEDLPELIDAFRERAATRNRVDPITLTGSALELLSAHDFPGNVRELRNAIESLTILADDRTVGPADILAELPIQGQAIQATDPEDEIREALARTNGHKADAAALLGISRSTLWRRMKSMGIDE